MRYKMSAVVIAAAFLGSSVSVSPVAAAYGWGASWWMNEPAGSTQMVDVSGNGHTGTLGPGVSALGGIYQFTGQGTVTVPDSPTLDPLVGDFRYEAMVRWTGGFRDPNFVQKGEYGTRGGQWKMDYFHGSGFCKVIGSKRQLSVRVAFPLHDGQWHVIICSKRARSISISVDPGTSRARHNVAYGDVGSIYNRRPVSIGGKEYCPHHRCDFFTGQIAWVIVRPL